MPSEARSREASGDLTAQGELADRLQEPMEAPFQDEEERRNQRNQANVRHSLLRKQLADMGESDDEALQPMHFAADDTSPDKQRKKKKDPSPRKSHHPEEDHNYANDDDDDDDDEEEEAAAAARGGEEDDEEHAQDSREQRKLSPSKQPAPSKKKPSSQAAETSKPSPHPPRTSKTDSPSGGARRPAKGSTGSNSSSTVAATSTPPSPEKSATLVPRAAASKSNVRRFYCYVNRDINQPKVTVTVDLKHVPGMDKFLDAVQVQVRPDFGVVRSLVHLASGDVVQSLAEIQDNEDYVVCGNKRYKALPYSEIVDVRTKEQQMKEKSLDLAPKRTATITAKAQYMDGVAAVQPRIILVVYNGDRTGDTTKVKLAPRDLAAFEKCLEVITGRMQTQLRFGDVKKLYTLEGKEVSTVDDIRDIRDGGVYVAVDRPPYKSPYLKWTPDGTLVKLKPKLPPVRKNKLDLSADPSQIGWEYLQQNNEAVLEVVMHELMCEVAVQALDDLATALAKLHTSAQEKLEALNSQDSVTRLYDDMILDILDVVMRPHGDENPSAFEDLIRTKFRDPIEAASKGKLSHWETDPVAFVALCILLDQFPRSLFRGTPRMYAYDEKGRDAVLRCIASGVMDQIDPPVYRLFPCFVLAHQEDVEMIRLCLREWDKVSSSFPNSDPIWETVRGFKSNLDIVEKFGRFPGRNEVLGREDTDEEKVFLRNGGILVPQGQKQSQGMSKRKTTLFGRKG
eukprot:m.208546 g.208546  ORF g.208546 m.208546 type:complete len:737 (-) comp22078_c0_seq1:22-2232(-)